MHWRSLSVSAAIFAGFCVVALALSLPSGAMLNFVSGTWIALGVDLHHGVFYRPLLGEAGFGGTRYFPLWIILHAGLMRLGLSPLAAGHLISIVSALAWIAGAYRLMQELAFPPPLARALSLLTLCTSAGVLALTTVRGDLLPAALNLWGAAYSVRAFQAGRSAAAIAIAASFFSLAVFAKLSAAFGVLAMAVALALNGLPKRAGALAAATLGSATILLLAANAASAGRMIETMRACATLGAVFWNYLHAPLSFLYTLVHQDPMSVVISTLFFAGLVTLPASGWKEIPTCLAVASLAMIVALDTSPGIDFNHFLDFFGCALIFVGYQIARGRIHRPLATSALSIAASMSVVLSFYDIREARRDSARFQVPAVRSYLAGIDLGTSPVFSDNPLFPAIDGRASSMIDVVMFRLLRLRDPRFASALESRIAQARFGAVVLAADIQTEFGRAVLADQFGDRFMPLLTEHYQLAESFSPYFVYRPRQAKYAQ
jgi:hypothetical protein